MVAEHLLHARDHGCEPAGWPAADRGDRLGGVTGPLGGLANVMQDQLALVRRRLLGRGGQPSGATPGPQHHRRQLDRGRTGGPIGQRWFDHQPVEPVEQAAVPLAVQLGHREPVRGPVPGRAGAGDPAPDRADHQRAGLAVEQPDQVVPDHLGVAGGTERPAQPRQLVPDRVGHLTVEQRTGRGQHAAQPTAGDPHLMDGVRLVGPHLRVEHRQSGHLTGQVPDQLATRAVSGQLGRTGRADRRGRPPSQRPGQLGGTGAGHRTDGCQPVGHGDQQRLVAADQLDLDLTPALHHRLAVRGARTLSGGRDMVVADLGEQGACSVPQPNHVALVRQHRDRRQRPAAQHHTHLLQQRLRHHPQAAAERGVHLGAGEPAARQLQVPAGIVTAGPPAQRDPVRLESQVVTVQVGGLELVALGRVDRCHGGQAVQRRQRDAFVEIELELYFEEGVGHAGDSVSRHRHCPG